MDLRQGRKTGKVKGPDGGKEPFISWGLVYISYWLRYKNFSITSKNHSEACLHRDNILFPETDHKQG